MKYYDKQKYYCIILLLSLTLLCLACASNEKLKLFYGERYLRGDIHPFCRCINLPMIYSECSLHFVEGDTIPPEISERVIMIRDDQFRRITGPNDLKGCADIDSPDTALEYLRFFSSENTAHLFDDEKKEIFPMTGHRGCSSVCMTPKNWDDLHLHEPIITMQNDGYKIVRFIIRPIPKGYMPTIYKETVVVHKDGAVDSINEEKITDDPKYTEGLGFGGFV